MRTLEVVLLASVVLGVAWLAGPWRSSRGIGVVVAVAVAAPTTAQLLLEQVRWQLVPLYLAAAFLAVAVGVVVGRRRLRLPRTLAVGLLVLSVAAAAGAWALPVRVLPPPAGASPVGTATFVVTDEPTDLHGARTDTGNAPLVAQIWYPAVPDGVTAHGPWVSEPEAVVRTAAGELGLPRFALGHLGLVPSHATPDAEPALVDGPLPVIVYSHGRTGSRAIHVGVLESLASHGYAVAAVDHAVDGWAQVLSDDAVERHDPDVLAAEVIAKRHERASADLVAAFADDIERVLRRLGSGDVDPLTGHLDLDRVALLGYSAGGAAAMLACARDLPCDAVVTLDPWVAPLPDEVVGGGLDVPLLSIRSEEWIGGSNDRRLRRLHAATADDEGRVAVAGTTHRDFTVLPFLSPLADLLGVSGSMSGDRTHEIVGEWTVRFLDHHLRERGVDPLRVPPAFAEAELATNGG